MHIDSMLSTHPASSSLDQAALAACLEACHDCAATCTLCADACLAEEQVEMLRRCIRLNLICAGICEATAGALSRPAEGVEGVLRAQLEACALACQLCGDECAGHAAHHEHCRVCAEACRRCAEACNRLLRTLPR